MAWKDKGCADLGTAVTEASHEFMEDQDGRQRYITACPAHIEETHAARLRLPWTHSSQLQ